MTDPFLILYKDIQEVWNDKKGLEWTNRGGKKAILRRLEKFANSLPERVDLLKAEIELIREL